MSIIFFSLLLDPEGFNISILRLTFVSSNKSRLFSCKPLTYKSIKMTEAETPNFLSFHIRRKGWHFNPVRRFHQHKKEKLEYLLLLEEEKVCIKEYLKQAGLLAPSPVQVTRYKRKPCRQGCFF